MRIATCVVTVSLLWWACGGSEDGVPGSTSSTSPQQNVTAGTVGLSTAVGGASAPLSSAPPSSAPVTTPPTAAAPVTSAPTTAPVAPASAPVAGAAAPAAPAAGGAGGAPASAPAAPTAGAGGAAMAATPAAGAGTCPAGEMCQVSTVGGFKFCAPMMQPLPPSCAGANAPCGSDMKGMCLDAAAIGFSGTFCLHNTCM